MTQSSTGFMFWDSEDRRGSESRFSLEEFYTHGQSYLIPIFESQFPLKLASRLYGTESRSVLPVQCKKTMQSLEEMKQSVQEFSDLLHETGHLPVIFIALRYRLLSILNLIEDQTNRLLDLINTYRVMCITPSQHEKGLRKEIHNSLERLLEYVSGISEQVKLLNDEAEKQERRLFSLLEE